MLRFALLSSVFLAPSPLRAAAPPVPRHVFGYTELRTNLPGGRHANVRTMRAVLVGADGTGRRVLAEHLTRDPDAWTQFAGWSPDGGTRTNLTTWPAFTPDE